MAKRRLPALRRRPPKRRPKSCFRIFCEGKKTEPGYFAVVRSVFSNALIAVEIVGVVGVPETIAREAIEAIRAAKRDLQSFELGDEVWAVFDRDDHPKFKDAVTLCENKKVRVGRSDPCFELWLILHLEDFDKPDDRHQVQAHLRKICPDYDGAKELNFPDLITMWSKRKSQQRFSFASDGIKTDLSGAPPRPWDNSRKRSD